jgi:transposase
MPAGNPQKRAEARRLVEQDGRSLREVAADLGVDEKTVRRWQKADEANGDGWALAGESAAQKARADALSPEERQALVERARRAAEAKWENRRRAEADAAGVVASAIRQQIMNVLPRIAAAALEDSSSAVDTAGMRYQRLTTGMKAEAIAYAVLLDKADRLAGVDSALLADDQAGSDPASDFAEARALVEGIEERRRLKAV